MASLYFFNLANEFPKLNKLLRRSSKSKDSLASENDLTAFS